MTITLTDGEFRELWLETLQHNLQTLSQEPLEHFCEIPQQLGKGYVRRIEVHPELSLTIFDYEYHDDVQVKIPDSDHPVQFSVCLSGFIRDSFGQQFGGKHTLISGGGVQRKMTIQTPKLQRVVSIDIQLSPNLLRTFFPEQDGDLAPELRFLVSGNDWQTLIYPEINPAIQGVAQQIANCSMRGIAKRIFLPGKDPGIDRIATSARVDGSRDAAGAQAEGMHDRPNPLCQRHTADAIG